MTHSVDSGSQFLVVFNLGDQICALALGVVERIVRAVEITPLPKAPDIVLGAINAQGRVLPVVDLRRRFGFSPRALTPDDRFILARTPRRGLVVVADSVAGVGEYPAAQIELALASLPFARYLRGVAKTADGLILIHDLDTFLSLDEERSLDAALPRRDA